MPAVVSAAILYDTPGDVGDGGNVHTFPVILLRREPTLILL